jgi:hypothetical protein
MRMRSAVLAIVMVALGMSDGARVLRAQQPATPRAPGGQGGGVQRPNRPPQPQGQRPVRDPRAPAVEGTATVRGRVVDAVTGAAISRAKVRTSGRDPRSSRVATTDAEGVFTLTKVPSGPLMLTVDKATYLQSSYPERSRTMRAAGVAVGDGQTIDNVTISMSRGGAITGRLLDAFGDPAENVMVQVIPASQNRRGMPSRGGMRSFQGSNDIGEFRVSRLEPGQYYLLAIPQRRLPNNEDGGSAIGRTFYPGVASIDQAQPITIERGQSLGGVDFQLLETTLTRVTGYVLNSKGSPALRGSVSARTVGSTRNLPQFGFGPDGGGSGIDNGTFDLMLQPGEYIIEAMASGDDVPSMNSFEMDRGQVRLTVSGEAMSGVTIATGRGGTVSGRFVFNGRSAPPASFQGFNIGFSGPEGGMGGECRAFNRPTVNPDGTFTAENMWGTCQVRGGGAAKGWTFEAVMHNGNDITNRVIEFDSARSLSGVEIVYSDRVADLAVTVSDERGMPIKDYVAVAFPVEKEKWGDQRFMRFQVTTPANNPNAMAGGLAGFTGSRVTATMETPVSSMGPGMGGSQANTLRTLLAGDYFVVALEDSAPEDLRDPEFLERLSQVATRVSVSVGSTESVQLRRVTLPQ